MKTLLNSPAIYEFFQNLMGASKGRKHLVRNFIKPKAGDYIFDIGCGPATILEFLPAVNYYGLDVNEAYIKSAESKYGSKAKFITGWLSKDTLESLPKFDIVIAIGLIHHVSNIELDNIIRQIKPLLKENGRFISIDPTFEKNQNFLAKTLVSLDRGKYVRDSLNYEFLMQKHFNKIEVTLRHKIFIPYSHCIMVCRNDSI